jgi:hypothetical protein
VSFDYAKAFEAIEENKNSLDVSQFMREVISTCKSIEPDQMWDEFLKLEYTSEVSALSGHVVSVLKTEPANLNEQGFWFGINNPVLENGETSAGIYFSVASTYDPDDEDASWACNAEFYPEHGSFNSVIMQQVYHLAYSKSKLGNKAEYTLCMAYGLKLAQAAMQKYKESNPNRKVGFAVGFDSGDFINVGWL